MFRARLPSMFITSHKMPRLPRNLHLLATWRSPDNAIRPRTRTKVLRLQRKMQLIFLKGRKSITPARQNDCQRVMKRVGLSRSATLATRNEATQHWKPPKVTAFCRTRHRHGHTGLTRPPANGCGRLRMVANGCGRKRNVQRTHRSTPRPPEWNGNPCYAFGKMVLLHSYASFAEGIHLFIPQSCPCFQVGQIQVLHPVETHEAAADGVKS